MANGTHASEELRRQLEKGDYNTKQAVGYMMASQADMHDANIEIFNTLEKMEEKRKERDEAQQKRESEHQSRLLILETKGANTRGDVEDLKKRSNIIDGINATLTLIIAAIFGGQNG